MVSASCTAFRRGEGLILWFMRENPLPELRKHPVEVLRPLGPFRERDALYLLEATWAVIERAVLDVRPIDPRRVPPNRRAW